MNCRKQVSPSVARIRTALAGAAIAACCYALALPAGVLAEGPLPKARAVIVYRTPLSPHEKVLQALNRFTFGPRPGDVEEVSRVGLDAWFQRQLHPELITDNGLTARLAQFPAMQLTQAELIARFPSPGMLRQYSRGALEAPTSAPEQVIYADAAYGYKAQRNAVAAGMPPTKVKEAVPPMEDSSVQAILALPPAQRMTKLEALQPEEIQALRAALKGPAQQRLMQGFSPAEMEQAGAMEAPIRVVGAEAAATRLLRDVYSERQLQALMTDFWLNHFNVYDRKSQDEPYLLPAYEREAILPHALGRFEDLLVATAESPAMLTYLDNWTSIGPDSKAAQRANAAPAVAADGPTSATKPKNLKGINENYARELMELHTLGVNGGYTQQDVIEVAKCFTGWTIERPEKGGAFVFNPNRHEPGAKTVLGQTIPEGGEDEGLAVLHILASSPRTAHFISEELAQRFVSDTPPPALVNRMTAAYLRSDGDIGTVLLAMFHSGEFWSSGVYRAKVKTPVEFVSSALRASDADVTNPAPLIGALARLGMPVYGMQTPNGYSWQADAWVSSSALVNRMNFALQVSSNHLTGTQVDWGPLLSSDAFTNGRPDPRTERALEDVILGEAAAPKTRAAVLEEVEQAATPNVAGKALVQSQPSAANAVKVPGGGLIGVQSQQNVSMKAPTAQVATMAGLLLGSPDFQRR